MIRVTVRGEDDRATIDEHHVELRRGINIDQKVKACGHNNRFAVCRGKESTPGRVLRPEADIAIDVSKVIGFALVGNTDNKEWVRSVETRSRASNANNFGVGG